MAFTGVMLVPGEAEEPPADGDDQGPPNKNLEDLGS